jgi:hypothetical protein
VAAQFPAPCCGNVAYIMTPSQTLILVLTARVVQLHLSYTQVICHLLDFAKDISVVVFGKCLVKISAELMTIWTEILVVFHNFQREILE